VGPACEVARIAVDLAACACLASTAVASGECPGVAWEGHLVACLAAASSVAASVAAASTVVASWGLASDSAGWRP